MNRDLAQTGLYAINAVLGGAKDLPNDILINYLLTLTPSELLDVKQEMAAAVQGGGELM